MAEREMSEELGWKSWEEARQVAVNRVEWRKITVEALCASIVNKRNGYEARQKSLLCFCSLFLALTLHKPDKIQWVFTCVQATNQ